MIYYANNGTIQSSGTALTTGWIGPRVNPLTNLISGFRLYEVDTGDFNIYEAYTDYSNVSTFTHSTSKGPAYEYEYSNARHLWRTSGLAAYSPSQRHILAQSH